MQYFRRFYNANTKMRMIIMDIIIKLMNLKTIKIINVATTHAMPKCEKIEKILLKY